MGLGMTPDIGSFSFSDAGPMASGISSGIAQTGANLIALGNMFQQEKQYKSNLEWQQQARLLDFWLQKAQWDREDTSIERRVADLRRSGLSPVLAAGQGASSSTTMHVNPYQRPAAQFQPQNIGIAQQIMEAFTTQAQIQKLNAETFRNEMLTTMELSQAPEKLEQIRQQNSNLSIDAAYKALELLQFRRTGVSRHGSFAGRTAADANALMRRLYEEYSSVRDKIPSPLPDMGAARVSQHPIDRFIMSIIDGVFAPMIKQPQGR